jgi:hypothetical protein
MLYEMIVRRKTKCAFRAHVVIQGVAYNVQYCTEHEESQCSVASSLSSVCVCVRLVDDTIKHGFHSRRFGAGSRKDSTPQNSVIRMIIVEVDQKVGSEETIFVVSLTTNTALTWTVSYRFTYFRILREFIENNVSNEFQSQFPSIFPLSWIMPLGVSQLAERKKMLFDWINQLFQRYKLFSPGVQLAISSFFNGQQPGQLIERFIGADPAAFPISDRCVVNTALVEIKDHPTYAVTVVSAWKLGWEVMYRFRSFRQLNQFIVERYPKLIGTEFPRTHKRSWYGMKLPIKELVERHVNLKCWVNDVVRNYHSFPDDVRIEIDKFFEGHADYEPSEIIFKEPNGQIARKRHADVAGKFALCGDPLTGVNHLIDELGLSDAALERDKGRLCSLKLIDISSFLLSAKLEEITNCPPLLCKALIADQLLKWSEFKLACSWESPNEEIEKTKIIDALEPLFECIYQISVMPNDDEPARPASRAVPLRSNSIGPGVTGTRTGAPAEYSGFQTVAGKLAACLHGLKVCESEILPLAFSCLERILDSGAPLGVYAVVNGRGNNASATRTATCVMLLGEVSEISPHLPFIDNAERVLNKLLKDDEAAAPRSIPPVLKSTAMVLLQMMNTETAAKMLESLQAKVALASAQSANTPAAATPVKAGIVVGGGVLAGDAAEALRQLVATPPVVTPMRRVSIFETQSPGKADDALSSPKKPHRRFSQDDNMLLRVALVGPSGLAEGGSSDVSRVLDLAGSPPSRSKGLSSMRSSSKELDRHTISRIPSGEVAPVIVRDFSIETAAARRPSQTEVSLRQVYRSELEIAFNSLVENNEDKRLRLRELLSWDQVASVISAGELAESTVSTEFKRLATTGLLGSRDDASIDFDAFCILMETLENT